MQYYNKEQMKKNYEILKTFYGNHTIVANALGITPDHYRKIRNKRTVMSTCLRKFIFTLAEGIDIKKIKMIRL